MRTGEYQLLTRINRRSQETGGGETPATEALASYVRQVSPEFRAIVPSSAKSNGTLLCLAAKEIVMSSSSQLGPIEPAVHGIPCSILRSPEIANANFALHKLGEHELQHSKTIALHLLSTGMMSDKTAEEINEVVEKLASRDHYNSHGALIDRMEAERLGLKIHYIPEDDETWKRIRLLYCMYDHDSHRSNFSKIFEGRALSTQIEALPPPSPTAPPVLPPPTP